MVAMDIHTQTIDNAKVTFYPKSENCHEFSTLKLYFTYYGDKGNLQIFVNKDSLDELLNMAKQIEEQVLKFKADMYEKQLELAIEELAEILIPTKEPITFPVNAQ